MLISKTNRGGCGDKGAHHRETLQTTGFYVGRIVIVTEEFAPISHTPAGLPIPMAIRMRFLRHHGIYRSDVVQTKTKPRGGTAPPPDGRPRAQVKERAGRITLLSSSAMSSGRLFLDRVGRHQSPSPLHRHGQHILIARLAGTNYHRTVTSVLTGCLSRGGKPRKFIPSAAAVAFRGRLRKYRRCSSLSTECVYRRVSSAIARKRGEHRGSSSKPIEWS